MKKCTSIELYRAIAVKYYFVHLLLEWTLDTPLPGEIVNRHLTVSNCLKKKARTTLHNLN